MNIRAPEMKRGKYDDLINWLKRLLNKYELWLKERKAHGMFAVLAESDQYVLTAQPTPAIEWEAAKEISKRRTMHWIHIYEACVDIQQEMEGWTRSPDDHLRYNIENIRAAIRWFEQNNVQEDFGIKY